MGVAPFFGDYDGILAFARTRHGRCYRLLAMIGGRVVNIFRLIICLIVFSFSGDSFASFPKQGKFGITSGSQFVFGFVPTGFIYSSYNEACNAYFSQIQSTAPDIRKPVALAACTSSLASVSTNGAGLFMATIGQAMACPANSSDSGSDCTCNPGTALKDGQCVVPVSDLRRCEELNAWFDSTFNPDKTREVPGKLPYDDSLVCVSPEKEGLGPLGDPTKGCTFKFQREMAWQSDNGSWTSSGSMSTIEPQLCNIGDPNAQEDPNNCPVGWKKSSNGDYCVPEQDKPITCPPGMKESSFVKGLCIPVDIDPDPYNPNPPKPVDPDPTNPNPTDPGPGDQCPAGRVKNADGKCELVSDPGPAPVDPDPNNPNPTDPVPGEPCPVGRVKNADGKCEKIPVDPCPDGYEKKDGQCVPEKSCEPETAWPEKCLPCEKDALNPNVCKEDPGKCEPDPAIPDKCGPGDDDDKSKFGGACAAGFTCEGDAIQCAIAKELHVRNCKFYDTENPHPLYESAVDGTDDKGVDKLRANAEKLSVSSLDSSGFGWSRGCPANPSFEVAGGTFEIPFDKVCPSLSVLSYAAVALTLLGSLLWIVGTGIKA